MHRKRKENEKKFSNWHELDTGGRRYWFEIEGKLGLSDVKTFGLSWEDCEKLMHKLGYKLKINVSLAA